MVDMHQYLSVVFICNALSSIFPYVLAIYISSSIKYLFCSIFFLDFFVCRHSLYNMDSTIFSSFRTLPFNFFSLFFYFRICHPYLKKLCIFRRVFLHSFLRSVASGFVRQFTLSLLSCPLHPRPHYSGLSSVTDSC